MKRKQITVIVILSVLGVALVIFFAWMLNRGPKRYSWYEDYDPKKVDQPYGTLYLRKLLEGYRPGSTFTLNETKPLHKLLADARPNTNYIFVGPAIYLNSGEMNALLSFVERGNDALIASNNFPRELVSRIVTDTCATQTKYQVSRQYLSVNLNFYHPSLKSDKGYSYAYHTQDKDVYHSWGKLSYRTSCDQDGAITPLGYQNPGGVNFVAIPYGKGKLYIHTNPIVFTNYFLAQQDKLDYASGVFGHLEGKDIILDEFSKIPFNSENEVSKYDSPLYFILQQPALKYAWWLLIGTVVLYVIFASRRRQRVIPVHEKKVNTSLEFVHLVSTLYYQNGNPLDMARKKMRYFLYILRSRYGFKATSPNEEQLAMLSEKSKVSLPEIKSIFNQYNKIEEGAYYNTQTEKLMGLYNAIENFKQKCK